MTGMIEVDFLAALACSFDGDGVAENTRGAVLALPGVFPSAADLNEPSNFLLFDMLVISASRFSRENIC